MPVREEVSQKQRGTSLAGRFLCLGGYIPRDGAHLVVCGQPALKEGPGSISSAQPRPQAWKVPQIKLLHQVHGTGTQAACNAVHCEAMLVWGEGE